MHERKGHQEVTYIILAHWENKDTEEKRYLKKQKVQRLITHEVQLLAYVFMYKLTAESSLTADDVAKVQK